MAQAKSSPKIESKDDKDLESIISAHIATANFARQFASNTDVLQSASVLVALQLQIGFSKKWGLDKTKSEIRKFLPTLSDDEAKTLAEAIDSYVEPTIIDEPIRDAISDVIEEACFRSDVVSFTKQLSYIAIPIFVVALIYWMAQPFLYPARWTATYYGNKDLAGAPFGIFEENWPEHDWGLLPAHPGLGANNFSVRWESIMELSRESEVKFTTISDDGIRLFVDDELLLDYWIPQDSVTRVATKKLSPGVHRIRLEYLELENGARISFDAKAETGVKMKFHKR